LPHRWYSEEDIRLTCAAMAPLSLFGFGGGPELALDGKLGVILERLFLSMLGVWSDKMTVLEQPMKPGLEL
jgi:hypothetical protein